jgi:hypothetical protein
MLITATSAVGITAVVVSIIAALVSSVSATLVVRSGSLRREQHELQLELKHAYEREVELVAREAFVAGMRDALRQAETGETITVGEDVFVGLPPQGESKAWRRDSKWIAERYRVGYERTPQDSRIGEASAAAAAEVIRKRSR